MLHGNTKCPCFKENYYFPRFQKGSNIFQGSNLFKVGGIQMLISKKPMELVIFQGVGLGPLSPSGSAHDSYCLSMKDNIKIVNF